MERKPLVGLYPRWYWDVAMTSAEEEAQPLHIEVNVSPVEGANYAVESAALKFQLYVEEVLIGTGDSQVALPDFTSTMLDFAMQKEK